MVSFLHLLHGTVLLLVLIMLPAADFSKNKIK